MPRARRKKTSDVPTRIYSYRCLPPITEGKRVEDQFWLAGQYRNALVEIEIRLREHFRGVQLDHPIIGKALQLYEGADGDVGNAYEDLRAAKSGVADPDLTEHRLRLAAAKELRALFASDLREAKRAQGAHLQDVLLAHPEIGPRMRRLKDPEISKEDHERIKAELSAAKRTLFAALHKSVEPDLALAAGYQNARDQAHAKRLASRADYSARGLRTGTYDRVETALKQAAASTKHPPHFKRCDGTGSIGTQVIGGMTVREAFSCMDPRLRIHAPGASDKHPRPEVEIFARSGDDDDRDTVPELLSRQDPGSRAVKHPPREEAWAAVPQLSRNLRRHAARTYVDLRVGSNPDRSPIFARFPVTLHRPLPKDAVIKWAYVVRKRVGRHYEWRFQVTIESEIFRACPDAIGTGACAIDLSWRRLFDDEGNQIGLRVGYLVDDTGREREIRVPNKLLFGMDKVYDLAGTRDKEFETARDRLVTWLRDRETPSGLTDRLAGLAQWRAPRKLQALVDAWTGIDWDAWRTARAAGKKQCNPSDFSSKANRITGDSEILAALQAWARHDRHLQNWQEHQRDRLIAHRRETWRVLAAELTNTYAMILIEGGANRSPDHAGGGGGSVGGTMKLTEIDGWERPEPEDGDPSEGREQRRMSRLAAPGELRAEIIKAAPKRGARVEVEETADSTRECAWCTSIEVFDAKAAIEHTCSSCSQTWDQDANACRNLLHRHGHSNGPVPPVPTTPAPQVLAPVKPKASRSVAGSNAVAALGKQR